METARDPGLFWAFFSTCLNLPPGVARCCLLCSFRRLQFFSRCSWDGLEVEVPPQCLLGNIVVWFSEGVPNPLAPSNLDVDSFLLSSCPQFFAPYDLWTVDAHDGPQAYVDKGLQFVGGCFCCSPCFRAINKDRFTLVLNSLSLVFLDITFDIQTGARMVNAVLVLPIFACMSQSDPSSLLILLPRYTKFSTS